VFDLPPEEQALLLAARAHLAADAVLRDKSASAADRWRARQILER
jgi:hypothetical protein